MVNYRTDILNVSSENYFQTAWDVIENLPLASFVFFDIDNTAIQTLNGESLIRSDFEDLYQTLLKERGDLNVCSISYRPRSRSIPELEGYNFFREFYMEDMRDFLKSFPTEEILLAMIEAMSVVPQRTDDFEYLVEILKLPAIKIRFLMALFGDTFNNIFLLDDGLDGEIAQMLGVGIQVKQ